MDVIDLAFKKNKRANFIPASMVDNSDLDIPLPIGYGQTISQPSTVRQMLEWLNGQPGDKILDVGSGSGWTSALLSTIVGSNGLIFAIDIVPELVEFGKANCDRLDIDNIEFYLGVKGFYGIPENAPYDRILVSAAAKSLPTELIDQLKVGGKMVIPVNDNILEISKLTDHDYKTVIHPGFIFVPLL